MPARRAPIFDRSELRFLKELSRARVEFMIVGLSAGALQGAPVVTQDVELWFKDLDDPHIRTALRAVGGVYLPSREDHPPVLAGDAVDLFDIVTHVHGIRPFEEEIKDALRLDIGGTTVAVLPLARIIASKRALDRPKDRLVLPVLVDALRTIRARTTRRAPKRKPMKRRVPDRASWT